MKGLSVAKFATFPSSGVYYCLPSKDQSHWVLLHRTEKNVDTGEGGLPDSELSHAQQYREVVEYFQSSFGIEISDIGRSCLPRGRVLDQKENEGIWIILHGDDTPSRVRHQIVSEFGLSALTNIKWEFDSYESIEEGQKQRLIQRCPFMEKLFNG